jgi:hypothetical protein
MKTFFAVFASVLLAGVILFAGFLGWQRIDRWEQGKDYWIARFRAVRLPDGPVVSGLSAADYEAQIAETTSALREYAEAARQLQLYLGNKPFGIPLTHLEREYLRRVKPIVSDDDFTRQVSAIIRRADPKASEAKKNDLREQMRKLCAQSHKPVEQQLAHLETFLQPVGFDLSSPPSATPDKVTADVPQPQQASSITPAPSLHPTQALPVVATLTAATEVSIRYGKTTLPRGTKLKIIGRHGDIISATYLDQTVSVPVSSTDVAK